MNWMQSNGEPSWMFVFVFLILLPVWMWVGEQVWRGVVRRWQRNR